MIGNLPDLSSLTSLVELNTAQSAGGGNFEAVSQVPSLERLIVGSCNLHGKMIKDFSNLTNLTFLDLSSNSLWTSEIGGLIGLKDNEDLTINLGNNSLIDPEILLELPSKFKIWLGGNVNISEGFKTRLREHFGNNVSF